MRAQFDKYAKEYRAMHEVSIAAWGGDPGYFARYKAEWLRKRFSKSARVLDFGAGIGNLTMELVRHFPHVDAYDPSQESLALASERAAAATFHAERSSLPEDHFDVAILANVLHHVPVSERAELVSFVVTRLRKGGTLILWEHNPLNPLTRMAVKDCPFDEDAVLLWPPELRRLLDHAGVHRIKRSWVVFFPEKLSKFRFLEERLAFCPLGAQCVMAGERA